MVLPSFRNRRGSRMPSPFTNGGFLDELFQDLEEGVFGTNLGGFGNTDIYEKDGSLHFEIELPGLTKDQINIQAQNNNLVITGTVESRQDEQSTNYIRRGRRYGKFRQSYRLPEEVEDPGKLKAKFENGVLHIQAELSKSLTGEESVDIEIE